MATGNLLHSENWGWALGNEGWGMWAGGGRLGMKAGGLYKRRLKLGTG